MTPESRAGGAIVTGPSTRPSAQPYGDVRGPESAPESRRPHTIQHSDPDGRGEPLRNGHGHPDEPHHAAARHRTDAEQLALEPTDYVTGDELRALRRVRSDRGIVTVDPGSAL